MRSTRFAAGSFLVQGMVLRMPQVRPMMKPISVAMSASTSVLPMFLRYISQYTSSSAHMSDINLEKTFIGGQDPFIFIRG